MANIVTESWRDRAFRAGEQGAPGQSIADILPAHDAESTRSNKSQYRLGKLVNRVLYDRNVASLEQLPETSPPRGTGDPHGEKETRGFAKARQRSRDQVPLPPVDSSKVIPASEFVSAGRRFLGREEFLATRCPYCGATDANARHVRLCRARRSTSTSPWYTRSPAHLNGCRSATR